MSVAKPPVKPSHHSNPDPEFTKDPRLQGALAARARRPAVMGDALLEVLSQDFAPAPRVTSFSRALVPVIISTAMVLGSFLLLPRSQPWTLGLVTQTLALGSMVALGVCVVFVRGGLGLGLAPRWRWAYVASSLLVFAATAASTDAPRVESPNRQDPPTTVSHAVEGTATDAVHQDSESPSEPLGGPGQCASYGTILAALAGAMMLHGARRTAPVSPSSAGASAGVCAGMVGALALHTHAPTGSMHVALAHGAPIVVGLVVGAVVGRKTLSP